MFFGGGREEEEEGGGRGGRRLRLRKNGAPLAVSMNDDDGFLVLASFLSLSPLSAASADTRAMRCEREKEAHGTEKERKRSEEREQRRHRFLFFSIERRR